MKKLLLIGIIGVAAGAATSHAQYITLDNYSSGNNLPITYGSGVPANGVSGALATPGTPLSSAWTVGLYFVGGTVSIYDPAGPGLPISPLGLGTGIGSTTQMAGANAFGLPGYFSSINAFNTGLALNSTVTLEIVIYPTAAGSYANALYREHSDPFTVPTVSPTSPNPRDVGDYMAPFSISSLEGSAAYVPVPVPEPATLAIAGLSALSLMIFRRRQL